MNGSPEGSHLAALGGSFVNLPPLGNDARRFVAIGAVVTAAYVIAAQIGFRVAFVAEQVTTVWAPTGIALAALLLWGIRLWPAVWLGAFLANAGADAPLWTAFVIATGNTLEALTAIWALRRFAGFGVAFRRVTDVVAFAVIAAGLCTWISATVGAATLCAAAVQPWERFPALWFDWWLGDALGALVVAPAIVTTFRRPSWSRRDLVKAGIFVLGTMAVTHLVFGQVLGFASHPLEFAVFPLIVSAAVSGGPHVTSLVVLSASAVTIFHTVRGAGPFATPAVHESLILLQAFMGVLAITGLLLAAAIAEREASEQRERDAAAVARHREQMLRLAQRAGGVATFEWDFRQQIARCSSEFFRIVGLPPDDGVMTGAEWGQFVHPEDRDRMTSHLARVLAGLEPPAADYRIVTVDGSVHWLSYVGQLQRTAEADRMVGTVVDITDRKRLEAELRHHAAEVERILESIGEGFVALDREFRYVYVNQAAEKMLGHSREALLRRSLWEVFQVETVGQWRQRLEVAMATGAMGRFEVHVAPWKRWYENRVYPSPNGLSIFFADVTARVQAEAALRESRDVLSLAMRGGSMGAWSRNLTTDEVWWSRELEEIFGLQPGAFDRTEAGFFEFVHPDDRERVREAVDGAVQTGSDYLIEFRFRHATGEWRWMEGRGRAVYSEDGTPRTLYGLGIDVTARKRSEMALQEAKEAAESANQLKDQFLATLSHELRTPLNAILGYARMLQTNTIAPEKRQRAIDVIERNAVAQTQLVEDLLDMSRITTGRIRVDPQPIPAAAVLREALEGVRPAADAKGIVLEVDLDPFAGTVRADPTRLQQVFWNLLTNAVKFTPVGGRVVASIRRNGADIEVSVADTGVGISADFLPFVFEPFRQAETRLGRGQSGLGLGLAISKQLVELHGGTIQAASAGIGQGAAFTIRLPRLRTVDATSLETPSHSVDATRNGNTTSPAIPTPLQGLDILLVDDEEDTLAMFRDVLEAAGASVRAVATASDAIRESEQTCPDLLVTGLGLPDADGWELLRTLRSRNLARGVPAVAVTASTRPDDRSHALAAGFQAHISKPVDPATLVRAIAAALSAR